MNTANDVIYALLPEVLAIPNVMDFSGKEFEQLLPAAFKAALHKKHSYPMCPKVAGWLADFGDILQKFPDQPERILFHLTELGVDDPDDCMCYLHWLVDDYSSDSYIHRGWIHVHHRIMNRMVLEAVDEIPHLRGQLREALVEDMLLPENDEGKMLRTDFARKLLDGLLTEPGCRPRWC